MKSGSCGTPRPMGRGKRRAADPAAGPEEGTAPGAGRSDH
jgi:hypothetical protein